MKIISSVFSHQGSIPSKFTCDGENINPPLEFLDIPVEAKSIVLIMDDPDVPTSIRPDGNWDHWLVWNISPDTKMIPENSSPPGIVGLNTGGQRAYGGPCPPDREHRYFFKLYALDVLLDFDKDPTKSEIEQAMGGHVLEKTELIGKYNRKK